jgi:hypothetical protein
MAISDAYATAAQYRAVVGKTDSAQDADVLTDLKAISRHLEGKLGRFFGKDSAAVARYYLPDQATRELRVDDLAAAPTSIKMDLDGDGTCETTLAATDYELLPRNAAKEPEAAPYTRIRMVDWGNYDCFYSGCKVEVTAVFGWPAVPEAVGRATIHLAAILRLETPRATRRIVELEGAIEASADAMSIVRQLTDRYQLVRYV